MQEYQKRYYKQKLEEKFAFKRNLKRLRRRQNML